MLALLSLSRLKLKANGEAVYWSTYCALTDGEQTKAARGLHCAKFDLNIQDKFGPETTPGDFPDLDIPGTPEHDNFNDVDYASWDDEWVMHWHAFTGDGLAREVDNEIPTPSLGVDISLPMPEAGDNYVNASLVLPSRNLLTCGTVIGQKCNAQGDPIGHTNSNPILDSCVYGMEFNNGKVC